ncbi:hypothetical protein NW762_005337 [Fusarium torreyae]|uniref:Carboxylic ester hydrolase n=1 Tax=Fusarium torreyae TaxID=1237075 RepID=A0A9W8S4U6_9HYPO|nr:hypothetical protein NW762_005337 [Fusarium torreyae]
MGPQSKIFLATVLALLFTFVNAVAPIVDLAYSKYRGKDLGNGVTQWLGMRYAAPPVGQLRFMPPQDPVRSRQTKDASSWKLKCIAGSVSSKFIGKTQSEDCLFINVFAPTGATTKSKFPVFVWIQGGGFNTNARPTANGTELIQTSDLNMVVVTLNYRVSIFGFLSYGDQMVPNIGLLDQRKAMQWVKKYIHKFGGNPLHITLGGGSSGGASVAFHLTAYGGRDDRLFHATAAESISILPTLTLEGAAYQGNSVAAWLNCTDVDVVACLRNKTVYEIQDANFIFPNPGGTSLPKTMWGPVVDGDLIQDVPYSSFAQGKFIRVPSIFGSTTNEGFTFVPLSVPSQSVANNFFQAEYPLLNSTQLDQITTLYSNQSTPCPSDGCLREQLSDSYGDMRFICSGINFSGLMSSWMPNQTWNYWYNVQDAVGAPVTHCVDVYALFGPEYASGAPPLSYFPGGINANITTVVQGYWASFIRSYNPNTFRNANTSVWGPYSTAVRQRMVFDTAGQTSTQNMTQTLQDRCDYFGSIGALVGQ